MPNSVVIPYESLPSRPATIGGSDRRCRQPVPLVEDPLGLGQFVHIELDGSAP